MIVFKNVTMFTKEQHNMIEYTINRDFLNENFNLQSSLNLILKFQNIWSLKSTLNILKPTNLFQKSRLPTTSISGPSVMWTKSLN